ncbi:hypothetical protein SLE2022_275480 [Rubroshorea leprosula]
MDEHYVNCGRTISCGNIDNIGYPFWGSDRPEYCGFPGFELNCSGTDPEITISLATYQVLQINKESRVLTVARADYEYTLCPNLLINTTRNPDLFEYSSDTLNITLYYGCPTVSNQIKGLSNQSDCYMNGTSFSYYYLARNFSGFEGDPIVTEITSSLSRCNNMVFLAANQSEIWSLETTLSPSSDALVNALSKGFGLVWNANNSLCDRCTKSGGKCGYNKISDKFSCYCTDKPYDTACPGKKDGVSLGVGIAIAGAVIVGICLGVLGLLLRQRRKRIAAQSQSKALPTPPSSKGLSTSTPSTNLSRSIASYSSAKPHLEMGSTYFGVQVFSYAELEEATDNFDPSKELGDGGFGTVYYGVLRDGRVVAVKRLYENNVRRVEQFLNEIKILADIRHPNLVTLYGCTSRHSRELLLVYEYIPNGTVADHLHGGRANTGNLLGWPVRLSIAIETANALAYLHANDIIHRDVKTNNILLDNNFHVKVADFGLSRLFPNDVTHVSTAPQGTPGYVDPEYYQCYHLTDKSDVYSFGVVLIELISAKQAVDTTRHRHDINLANMAISRIQNQALHELVDPSLAFETDYAVKTMITAVAALAFRCLQNDRDMRPSMGEVLEVLKGMQNEESRSQIPEVVDIAADDVGLLRHVPPPLSPPDSAENDKWVQIKTM